MIMPVLPPPPCARTCVEPLRWTGAGCWPDEVLDARTVDTARSIDERSCDLLLAASEGTATAVVSEDFDDAVLSSRSAAADRVAGVASAMTVAPVTRVARIRRWKCSFVVRRPGS